MLTLTTYVVLAVIAIGADRFWVCQPEAVSLVKVTVASRVPDADQMWPVCVPVSCGVLVEPDGRDLTGDAALNERAQFVVGAGAVA